MRRIYLILSLSLFINPVCYSKNITNKINGVGLNHSQIKPTFCIQDQQGKITELAPDQTINGNAASGHSSYIGGALRFGGCDAELNTYLGYLGVYAGVNGYNIASYTPPEGIHIQYTKGGIDSNGNLTGAIEYTPIAANLNLFANKEPASNPIWDFVGANLSGLEFGKVIDPVVIPNLSTEDMASERSDLFDTVSFLNAGMNTFRVPISWGYLQLEGPGKGKINSEYYDSFVKPLLESLTHSHVYTIVDLHAYMRYSEFGKEYSGCGIDGPCPDGKLILDPKAYQDVWLKLYRLIKQDPDINLNYILFDLMNEPVDIPNDSVFMIQASVIKSLRNDGYQGPILVEGNSWSGLHSWTTDLWPSTDGQHQYSNAVLFTRKNFSAAGITDLSKIYINVHQYLDKDFSGTHADCQTDLSTTGENGFNLDAFTAYLKQNQLRAIVTEWGGGTESSSCSIAMTNFLNYLSQNSAKNKSFGFSGWTLWSTGHGWGHYNLRVTPTSYHMKVLEQVTTRI